MVCVTFWGEGDKEQILRAATPARVYVSVCQCKTRIKLNADTV